jgi:predicted exporter
VEPVRQKWLARWALLAFVALCAVWFARLDYHRRISTDVLDLLPAGEQAPEVSLVRSLAGDAQGRVMLFAVTDGASPSTAPEAVAEKFAASLRRSPAFAEVVVLSNNSANDAAGRALFEKRFQLLLPTWLQRHAREFAGSGQPPQKFSAWLAERAASELEVFLGQPEAFAAQELVHADPLLLVPGFIARNALLAPAASDSGGAALVWARIHASPLVEEGQAPVFNAIDQAWDEARAGEPRAELRWTGVNRFAAASRSRIQSELGSLNLWSVIAVLGVSALLVGRIWKLAHLVPGILLSLLGAWTVSTLVFPRVHILVFVIGALLTGVAIDYGFYIFMQPSRRPDEPYAEKLRRLLKPLLASCLTTVIGFSLLALSPLPLLREVGVFVGAGLICALGATMLYFAQLERPFLESRVLRARLVIPRWLPRSLFVAGLVVAVAGPWRIRWRDDVRDLQVPLVELQANDRAVRSLFGDAPERTIFLTHGATPAEARQRLDDFLAYAAKAAPDATLASAGSVMPTEADWRVLPKRLAELGDFSADFQVALQRHGFEATAFTDFFSAWNAFRAHPPAGDYAALCADFSRQLKGPLALLYKVDGPLCWFMTIAEQAGTLTPPRELQTVRVDQLESLNTLFTRYRWSALRLSLAGLGLVIASVLVLYRGRPALRIALIPAGSCFFIFGLFGLCGQTLNLFHLLGAFLGVCLSHNYAIFSSETTRLGNSPPPSIRLSALSTAASFGVLAFSRIPVIHALGLTVALIVVTALVIVELEPFARRAHS